MRPSAAITRASRADIVLATESGGSARRYRGLNAASGWLDDQLRELFEPASPSDLEHERSFGYVRWICSFESPTGRRH